MYTIEVLAMVPSSARCIRFPVRYTVHEVLLRLDKALPFGYMGQKLVD